jgi:hypothetical protein
MNYSGSIALTKLISVEMEMKSKDGTMVKGIFIPYKNNYITEKEGAAYVSVNVNVHDAPDKYGQSGFIAHKMDSESYKAMDADARKEVKLPILGNFKSFEKGTGTGNDTSGKSDGCITPDDQLPF